MTTAIPTKFEDRCYPPQLVEKINALLERGSELDAVFLWKCICKLVRDDYIRTIYPDDEPFNSLNPVHLSLETEPREQLLQLICGKKVPGYRDLAAMFGFVTQ